MIAISPVKEAEANATRRATSLRSMSSTIAFVWSSAVIAVISFLLSASWLRL
jgi:hypothetical protein